MAIRPLAEEAAASVLCWFATSSAQGVPNVSPKEVFSLVDDRTLVVADIASPVTVRNLRANPNACASFIDVFRQTGYKLIGRAEVVAPDDERFDMLGAPLVAITRGEFRIRHVIRLQVETAAKIIAPGFRVHPERSLTDRMAEVMRRYGVVPAEPD